MGGGFGGLAWIFYFGEAYFDAAKALAANILGGVGDDRAYPGASLWAVEAGMVDGLQDLDPTDLEGVFSKAVIPGNSLGEGKEALGTAGNPSFLVPF